MQLFLDTADVEAVRRWAETGFVDGVTTNASLIAAAGRDLRQVIAELCELVPGPVCAATTAEATSDLLAEAEVLADIAPNVVIKLPMTWAGLEACRTLSDDGVKTCMTLCFSAAQALLAAKAGATFTALYLGRMADHGADGGELLAQVRGLYDAQGFEETEILAASLRTPGQVGEAALAGAEAATLAPALFEALVKHPLTEVGLDHFSSDWKKTGQSIL